MCNYTRIPYMDRQAEESGKETRHKHKVIVYL